MFNKKLTIILTIVISVGLSIGTCFISNKLFNKPAYSQTNSVTISDIKKIAKLQVLPVRISYPYDGFDKKNAITLILDCSAQGIYTVDLNQAVYYINDTKSIIDVVIPDVQLTDYTLLYNETEIEFYENDWGNDSTIEGANLVFDIYKKAHNDLRKKLELNKNFIDRARNNAKQLIKKLLKKLVNNNDLQVNVYFENEI